MASSPVSICSNALLMLGAQTISDFAENNDRARLASNLYPTVRDSVLRSHPWNCAVKRVVLSPDVATPAFDWAFQFTLPSDFIRTLSVGEDGCEDTFKIENGKVLSDNDPCYLRYIFRNENVATWDDMLVEAMQLTMASRMAYATTQSAALRDSVASELLRFMQRARAVDGQDESSSTVGDSPLLNSRFGGGPGNYWRR